MSRHDASGDAPGSTAALLQALPLLVFASGASALVYQTLWLRSFGLIFGNTTRAVSLVLATFMTGLALGSALVARLRPRRPALAYAAVEAGVGASALLTLPLLEALPGYYSALAHAASLAGPAAELMRVALAAALLLPTTVLAGAALPLVVEIATRARGGFRARFAALYRVNTLGAAAGVVAAALVGLPALGVRGTFLAAACVNLVIGALAWRWREAGAGQPPSADAAPASPLPALFAVFAAASGAASFALEVVWTRTLALVIGSSFYSFALMLIAFLLGIAGGAFAYERLAPRLGAPRRVVGGVALAIGALILLDLPLLGALPELFLSLQRRLPVDFAAQQAAGFALCLASMLPLTLGFGFLLPALTHLARDEAASAQRLTGLLYAWNTAGAVCGALLADRLLIPALGLQGSLAAIAAPPLALGAWAVLSTRAVTLRLAAAATAAALVASAAHHWRPWDPLVMSAGVYKYGIGWREDPATRRLGSYLTHLRRMLFYREGAEALVSVIESRPTGGRFLAVNGKTEAGDAPEDALTQRFIAHVPLLLHPGPRDVLVIGWGSGATAGSASLHPLERLEAAEIEPAVFETAPLFAAINHRVDRDPRFRIRLADARNLLLTDERRWDAILSEPSNPWISGVSNLFTRDFYEIALARLAPGGLFCQWFHYYNLTELDVRGQLATFASVFPEVSVWLAPPAAETDGTARLLGDLLLIGSREPLALSTRRVAAALADPRLAADLAAAGGLDDPIELAATWAMGRDELRAYLDSGPPPPLNSDDHPYLELSAPRSNAVEPAVAARQTLAIHDALVAAAGLVPPLRGEPALAAGAGPSAAIHLALARAAQRLGRGHTARRRLESALSLDPDSGPAHGLLGRILAGAGELASAERHLLRSLDLAAGDRDVAETLVSLYLAREQPERAAVIYQRLLEAHPDDATTRAKLGAVLIELGRLAEARHQLARAVALAPQLTVAADLLRQLDRALAR